MANLMKSVKHKLGLENSIPSTVQTKTPIDQSQDGGRLAQPKAEEPQPKENTAMTIAITYTEGTGRTDKAKFHIGKAAIPSSMVTKLLKKVEGKTGSTLDRIFWTSIPKHAAFIEAMDANNITPAEAVQAFKVLKPAKVAKAPGRAAKGSGFASVLAKMICRRLVGDKPEQLYMNFLEQVSKPEFSELVIGMMAKAAEEHGTSPSGHIKVSKRKANPNALNALKEAREARHN